MKIRFVRVFVLVIAIAFLSSGGHLPVSAENRETHVRFQVTTVVENGNERRVLAQTTIEGLPGTDFGINLQTGNFKMQARFLSDLIAADRLKIRAQLDTRRFYGYSPQNLPLYEEDSQKQALELGFDESVVLLPFGRGTAETLKIEIVPTLLTAPTTGESSPLTINFDQPLPSGEINIEAVKIPHKFSVEALLIADGQTVARSSRTDCLLEEEKEIELLPISNGDSAISNQSFRTKLTVNKFISSRPEDLVGINFDLDHTANENQMIMRNGAGIGLLGGEMTFPLENTVLLPGGKKYELKFKIRFGADENAN